VRTRFRTVWISDTHLGSRGCQAELLSRFLRRIDCDQLYLVGDIVDFWRLRRSRAWWPTECHDVLRRVLKLVHRGTSVTLVPGNHDETLRRYVGLDLGGVLLAPYAVHECLDGRRLLVTHGDEFDLVVMRTPGLAKVGSVAYEALVHVNRWFNRGRRLLGMPYWSLSQHVKRRVKSACTFISRFRETLTDEARRRGFDGVVCGHIHKAEVGIDGDFRYFNCGDWVESCTAIVEHEDGRIDLLHVYDIVEHGTVDDDPNDPDGWAHGVEIDVMRHAGELVVH
jgi:UDP-2,3-diacylglucosamine pyrophosphatase LpxH